MNPLAQILNAGASVTVPWSNLCLAVIIAVQVSQRFFKNMLMMSAARMAMQIPMKIFHNSLLTLPVIKRFAPQ
jgi:hypothetical protein